VTVEGDASLDVRPKEVSSAAQPLVRFVATAARVALLQGGSAHRPEFHSVYLSGMDDPLNTYLSATD